MYTRIFPIAGVIASDGNEVITFYIGNLIPDPDVLGWYSYDIFIFIPVQKLSSGCLSVGAVLLLC